MTTRTRKTQAQGMTEYVVLIGVVAIGLTGAVRLLSGSMGKAYSEARYEVNRVRTAIDYEKDPYSPDVVNTIIEEDLVEQIDRMDAVYGEGWEHRPEVPERPSMRKR